jgi:tape measure domain-containing protein
MSTVTAATVEAILRVRDSNFSVSMNNADKAVKKTEQSVKSLSDRLQRVSEVAGRIGGSLTAGVTAPLLALGAAAVQTTVKLDSLKIGLTAVAGSSQEAEKQLVRLREIAKMPGLGFAEAIQGSIRLQAAGFSAQQAEKALREFGNAVATVGGGKAELDGINLALSQIASKGKVSAEEINQLNERLPQVRKAMIEAFGTADTEILQKANITANEFLDTMTTVLSRDKRVGESLKNTFENAQDSISDSLDRIGRAITPRVAKALESVAMGVERLTKAFDGLPKYQQDLVVNLGIAALIAGPTLSGLAKVAELMLTIRNATVAGGVASGLKAGAGSALGAAAVATAPVTIPLMIAGGAAWFGAQDSIANSEQQMGALSLPNQERITNLQGQIAARQKAMNQLAPRHPARRQRQAEIDQMQREINTLSRFEMGQSIKKVLPNPKDMIDQIMNRKGPIIDANARAKANSKDPAAEKAKRLAEQGDQYLTDLNQRLRVLIAERAGKFAGQRAGISNDFDNALARANELGVGAQALPILKNIYDYENTKVNQEESGERVARLGQDMMRDQGQLLADLKARTDARIARQKALVAGSAEMQASLAMSNPALGTISPQAGGAAGSASPLARALGGGVARGGGLSFPQIRAQMAASGIARFGGDLAYGGVMDLAQGRNVLGNALERVKGVVFQSIGEEIGRGVERSLRKRLSKVFEDAVGEGIGDKLEKSLNSSLAGINASAGAILSGAYSLISALSRKKQFGLGSILGGIGGFLLGGPMGAIQGYNIGGALDNRDYGGAIMGGLSTQINTGSGGGTTTQPGPADGRAVKRGMTVVVQHYGNNYGLDEVEGAGYRQGRAIERQLAFNG